MKLSNTIGFFSAIGYSPEYGIDICAKAGFDALDFAFHSNSKFSDADSVNEKGKQWFKDLRKRAEDNGLVFNQAHAPFPSSVTDPDKTEEIFQNIVRCFSSAEILGISNVIVHPKHHLMYWEEGVPEKLFDMNMEFFNRLLPYAKDHGIVICTENMYSGRAATGVTYIDHASCSTAAESVRYIDNINDEHFKYCLDIGHAILCREEPVTFIRTLGKERLKALHVHDVNGVTDMHTLPYYGGAGRWESICKALKEIGYTGDFTYEASNFMHGLPEELLLPALKYMVEVGRYLISRIEG